MEQTEQKTLPRRTLHYFWQAAKPNLGSLLIIALAGILANLMLNTFVPLVFSDIIDKLTGGDYGSQILNDFLPLFVYRMGFCGVKW